MRYVSVPAALCLLAALPLFAGDGAIPIWEPTTISEPGNYILIRNVGDFLTDDTITIAADNVDLDLNGFTITGGTTGILATSVSGVSVHDGFILCATDGLRFATVSEFSVRRLTIESEDDAPVSVSGSRGVVEGNKVSGEIFSVHGNSISVLGNESSAWLFLDCVGCRVAGNEYSYMQLWGTGNLVRDSTTGRIDLYGSDNLVKDNVVTSSSLHGLVVTGSRNQVEGNLLMSHDRYGLRFEPASTDNVYRGNTVRGNAGTDCTGTTSGGDFCDEGTNNTSHGDNYMPDKM